MTLAITTVLALADEEIQAATVPPITFLVTAVIAIAIILLGLDLVRRIRRAQYREEIQQSLEAELAEREAGEGTARGATATESSPAEGIAAEDADTAGSADSDDRG